MTKTRCVKTHSDRLCVRVKTDTVEVDLSVLVRVSAFCVAHT